MLLKQQVIGLKAKEEEAAKKEAEVQRKLKKLKDLESDQRLQGQDRPDHKHMIQGVHPWLIATMSSTPSTT